MKQEKENKNIVKDPIQYVYEPGVKVEVEGRLITDMLFLLEGLIEGEIKKESKFKYKYVNTTTDKVVKDVKQTDLASGKVIKVLDVEKTILNPTFDVSITEKGVAYTKLKNFLENVHYENVKSGKAVHYSSISKESVVK